MPYAPYVLDIDFAGALGALLRLCSLFRGNRYWSGLAKGATRKIIYNLDRGKDHGPGRYPAGP